MVFNSIFQYVTILAYAAHGMCYLWQLPLVYIHLVSDTAIALAYIGIPIYLVYLVVKKVGLELKHSNLPLDIILWFAASILLCGVSHLFSIWNIWHTNYWLSGYEKLVTGVVSLYTMFILPKATDILAKLIKDEVALEEQTRAYKNKLLYSSEQRFAVVFNQAAVGLAQVGLDGKWLRVNPKFSEMLQYTEPELLEKFFQELTHKDDLEKDLECVKSLIEGHDTQYTLEKRYICKKGRYLWVNLSVSLVKDLEGKPEYFIAVAEDITRRKKAEEELIQHSNRYKLTAKMPSEGLSNDKPFEVVNEVIKEAREFLDLDRLFLFKFEEDWGGIIILESVNPSFRQMLGQSLKDPEFAKSYVDLYRKGRIQVTPDIHNGDLTDCHVEFLSQFSTRANLVVPIVNIELWGLLVAQQCSRTREWGESEVTLIQQLASQIAFFCHEGELSKVAKALEMAKGTSRSTEYLEHKIAMRNMELQREVFARNKAENALKILNRELEIRVINRTKALTQSNKELQDLNNVIKQSEKRFSFLADTMPQIVWTATSDGYTDYFNKRWYELRGTKDGDDLGWIWLEVLHPEDVEYAKRTWKESIQTGKDYQIEYRFYDFRTEEYRWHLVRGLPMKDESNKVIMWVGTCTDIHDQKITEKQLTEVNQRLQLIMDLLPQSIWWKDTESRFLGANKTAAKWAGVNSPEELVGKNDYDFWSKEEAEFFRNTDKRIMDSGKAEYKLVESAFDSEGNKAWLETNKIPLFDVEGALIGTLGTFEFITERINREERLKAQNEELIKISEELADSNKELSDFVHIASHDLQEPLRMVSNYVSLLERTMKDKLDDRTRKYINYALNGSKRMKLLIDDVLQYSRAGKKDIVYEQVNLGSLLDNVLITLSSTIQECEAQVNLIKPLPIIVANSLQMDQLFTNLISNALKFKNKDKTPYINIDWEDKQDYFEFKVEDNGIGIKEMYYELIFEVFQRLHTREDYEGSGIGLSICKKIVTRHSGRIWVKSEIGVGTSFFFTISKKLTNSVVESEQKK